MRAFFKSMRAGLIFVAGVFAGLFFYRKALDKPETVINNNYDKVKTKGQNNETKTENTNTIVQDNKKEKKKRRLFRKK